MKIIFVSTILCTCFAYVLSSSQYDHSYGKGHGGGHGFYGYPVGRKWGYSTYIKHPAPKNHYSYGGHEHGDQGYGRHGGFGDQRYGYGGPAYRYGYWPNYGGSYGQGGGGGGGGGQGYRDVYPPGGYSHTYRREYVPYGGYDFDRKRREDVYGVGSPPAYNSYGQHKNHNYGGGDGHGAHSKTYNTGKPITKHDHGEFNGLEGFFGEYGSKL